MKKTCALLCILIWTGISFEISAQHQLNCKDFHQIILETANDFNKSKKNPVTDNKGNLTYETTLPSLGLNPQVKTESTYNLITEKDELKSRYISSKVFFENETEAQKVYDNIVKSISSCFQIEAKTSNFMGILTNLFEVEYQEHPAVLDISILHLSKDKKSIVTISIKKK